MEEILKRLLDGELSIGDACDELKILQIQEIGDNIKFDGGRKSRLGVCEAVYSQGKSDDDLISIINNIEILGNLMITKLGNQRFNKLQNQINEDILDKCTYNDKACILTVNKNEIKQLNGKVAIITAGTADIPVAEEARITIEQAGYHAITLYDVGVAGIHRLISKLKLILEQQVDVIITIAGMEGALPSVVAGLVDMPVIAVPTSTGYGVGEKGFTALFSMLQSCAPGIATVNIDNGYGAAVYAITILNQIAKYK